MTASVKTSSLPIASSPDGPQVGAGFTLGEGLTLPLEAVTETFAILAKRGSGKTYCAAVFVEEMVAAGQCVVVADPVGVWWGLRVAADGVGPGLPILILGGEHADLPLVPEAGAAVADLVAEGRVSLVLDLSLLTPPEQTRFMTGFAERLYRVNRRPLHLVLDEADQFVPQVPETGQQPLLWAMNRIVRLGRARGLGVTLISQRPAVLSKNVLTQAEVLVALRLTSAQDRKAVEAWVGAHGAAEARGEMLASLSSLPVGTAWVWSPGWLGLLQRVEVRHRLTYDSSATPKVSANSSSLNSGSIGWTPITLAPLPLEDTVARLKARLVESIPDGLALEETALPVRTVEVRVPVKVRVEVPVLREGEREEMQRLAASLLEGANALSVQAGELRLMGESLLDRLNVLPTQASPSPTRVQSSAPLAPAASQCNGRANTAPSPSATATGFSTSSEEVIHTAENSSSENSSGEKMPLAERKILTVLAQYPGGRTKSQVALLSGYAVGGGGFNNALSALRSKGWINKGWLSGSKGGLLCITADGCSALGTWERLPEGTALVDYWRGQLAKAERLILQVLVDAYPRSLSKAALGEATGYAPDGGGFGNALSRLRTLELVEGRGEVRASPTLCEV